VERQLLLVLKLLADIGIVGLPNAGKSTLISRLTDARPKIGDYPFTTLTPTLGVLREGDNTFVITDIPGIVEGAAQGRGLGLTFLKHIERTRMLLLVLDVSGAHPMEDYNSLKHELSSFNKSMLGRERIVVLNKADKVSEEEAETWRNTLVEMGEEAVTISALKGWGIDTLKAMIKEKNFDRVVHA
jgi:GTP-binding protein